MALGTDPALRLSGSLDLVGRKILVVDDDAANIRFIQDGLGESYRFFEAPNGEAALGLVRDAMPDLVLSDVEMPRLSGLELCRIIKSNPRFSRIPFILMAARSETDGKVKGLELGADDYLVKPVNLLELSARVRSMLRLKALSDELLAANQRLSDINQKLQELSMYDTLTGIYNRLYFNKRFDIEFRRAVRYRLPLTCVMIDIDHFKQVNDSYGHQFGDVVLRGVAQAIHESLRQVDLVARYGGEEFVVILPSTPLEQGVQAAERLRRAVESTALSDGRRTLRRTVSMGVAAFPHDDVHSDDDLLRCADEVMYRAKEGGRNRVEVYR